MRVPLVIIHLVDGFSMKPSSDKGVPHDHGNHLVVLPSLHRVGAIVPRQRRFQLLRHLAVKTVSCQGTSWHILAYLGISWHILAYLHEPPLNPIKPPMNPA